MKKIVLIYGIIAGLIVGAMLIISAPLWNSGVINHNNGELVGYTTMVIAFSVIFVGIKSYRDKHGNGTITFWKGTQIGLLILLIAAVMYALSWEISRPMMEGDFMAKMEQQYIADQISAGATEVEIQKTKDQFAMYADLYKNPVLRLLVTMMETLPVGIIITLISAALLRKKEFLPASETTVMS